MKRILLLLSVCLLAVTGVHAKLYIARENIKVHSGKGSKFEVIGEIPKHSKIDVLDTAGAWRRVEEEGVTGYISSKLLEEATEDAVAEIDAEHNSVEYKTKDFVTHHVIVSIGAAIVLLLILRSISLAISARRSERNAVQYEEKYKSLIKYWFQCKHCAASIKNDAEPSSNGCSKSLHHHWTNLGEVGQHKYHCKNCNVTINTKLEPNDHGCPSSTLHRWEKKRN